MSNSKRNGSSSNASRNSPQKRGETCASSNAQPEETYQEGPPRSHDSPPAPASADLQEVVNSSQIVSSTLEPPPRPMFETILAPLNEPGEEPMSKPNPKLIEKSTKPVETIDKFHSMVKHEKQTSYSSSVDDTVQEFLQLHAKIVSSALKNPLVLPLEESPRLSQIKEPREESKLDSLPELIQKSTKSSEKSLDCHSAVICGKHTSCFPPVDASTQQVNQCQPKIVSSALDPPLPHPLEGHMWTTTLREYGGRKPILEHSEYPHGSTEKSKKSSEELHKYNSIVQCEKSATYTPQQVLQCLANIVSSAMEFPPPPPLEEKNWTTLYRESTCNRSVGVGPEQVRQCQPKIVSSASEPPAPPPLEKHIWTTPLKESEGRLASLEHFEHPNKSTEKNIRPSEELQNCNSIVHYKTATPLFDTRKTQLQKSIRPSEELQNCNSIVRYEKNTTCNPPLSVAPQHSQQCQAKIVSSAALKPPLLLPLEDHSWTTPLKEFGRNSIVRGEQHTTCNPSEDIAAQQVGQYQTVSCAMELPLPLLLELVRPTVIKEMKEGHTRDSLPGPMQKSIRPLEKLRRSHSADHRGSHVCSLEVPATPATKPNEERADTLVAEPKAKTNQCQGRERINVERPLTSTVIPDVIAAPPNQNARDPNCPSRKNRMTNLDSQDPTTHAALLSVKQKQINVDLPELSDTEVCPTLFVERTKEQPAQRKLITRAEVLAAQRKPRPLTEEQLAQGKLSMLAEQPAHRKPSTRVVKLSPRQKQSIWIEEQLAQWKANSQAEEHSAQQKSSARVEEKPSQRKLMSVEQPAHQKPSAQIEEKHPQQKPSIWTPEEYSQQKPSSRAEQPGHLKLSTQIQEKSPLEKASQRTEKQPAQRKPSTRIEEQTSQRKQNSKDEDHPAQKKSATRVEELAVQRKSNKPADAIAVPCSRPAKPVAKGKNAMRLRRKHSQRFRVSNKTFLSDHSLESELSDGSCSHHKEQGVPLDRHRDIIPEKLLYSHQDVSSSLHDRPRRRSGHKEGAFQQSPYHTSLDELMSRDKNQSERSRTSRRLRPSSRHNKPLSNGSSTSSDTSESGSYSNASNKCSPPPRSRHDRAPSPQRSRHERVSSPSVSRQERVPSPPRQKLNLHLLMPKQPFPDRKRSTSPKTSKPRLSPAKKPSHQLMSHHLAIVPAKVLSNPSVADKKEKEKQKKPEKQLALVPAKKPAFEKGDKKKKAEKHDGTLRKIKDKLALILHHHHDHHSHPAAPESKAVSKIGKNARAHHHHASIWEYIRQLVHHSNHSNKDSQKKVTATHHGFVHQLFGAVVKHIWGTRQQRAAKAERRRLQKLAAGRSGVRRLSWWQRFHKQRGVKVASKKKPRFTIPLMKKKGKKS